MLETLSLCLASVQAGRCARLPEPPLSRAIVEHFSEGNRVEIHIPLRRLKQLAESRKMVVDAVTVDLDKDEHSVRLSGFADARLLADRLVMPMSSLIEMADSDLDEGIRVCRREDGFVRDAERQGKLYYTYQHLATSNAAPELMALRVTVYCNKEEDVVLNAGHGSKELVYVTKGNIRMHWNGAEGTRNVDLAEGDSVYLNPDVPHSFRALDGTAELLAFNYS